MIRSLISFLIVLGLCLFLLTIALQKGYVLSFLDSHPDPNWVPIVEYAIAESYYLTQNLTEAATYFHRVSDQYPKSRLADDAYFNYIQVEDDSGTFSSGQLLSLYENYQKRFAHGAHASVVRNRIGSYRTNNHL